MGSWATRGRASDRADGDQRNPLGLSLLLGNKAEYGPGIIHGYGDSMAHRRCRPASYRPVVSFADVAVMLLAAGRGERFGADKLAAELGGLPLCHHAAKLLGALPFGRRIAVIAQDGLGLQHFGFELVRTGPGAASMSRSIAAGVAALARYRPAALLLALADMPFVPAVHIENLAAQFDGNLVASSAGGIAQPPAMFGPEYLPALARLDGDKGARDLLRAARLIEAQAEWLQDIDTKSDLKSAQSRLTMG